MFLNSYSNYSAPPDTLTLPVDSNLYEVRLGRKAAIDSLFQNHETKNVCMSGSLYPDESVTKLCHASVVIRISVHLVHYVISSLFLCDSG